MFDTQFDAIARKDVNFYPEDLRTVVDETIDAIYQPINNGVYRAGFTTTQLAYEEAVTEPFDALDYWEGVLADNVTCAEIAPLRQTGVCSTLCVLTQFTTSTSNATCAALLITRTSELS